MAALWLIDLTFCGFSYANPEEDEIPKKPVFWRRDDFEEIMRAFCLPRRYSQVLAAEHTIFAALHPDDAAGRFGRDLDLTYLGSSN